MFDNIGNKIKTLAFVSTLIGMAGFVIYGLVLLCQGMVLVGILVAALGCLSAWIGSFLLYAFGELIEQQEINNAYAAQIVRLLNSQINPSEESNGTSKPKKAAEEKGYSLSKMAEERTASALKGSDFWLCKFCNTKNDLFSLYCKNCGQFK